LFGPRLCPGSLRSITKSLARTSRMLSSEEPAELYQPPPSAISCPFGDQSTV